MAVDPSVRIDIAAEFTGKKAFKQADTSTAQLSKNVKNLAKTFGVAFSTAKVLAYAKASIRAAAADQKAQQQLALALKNVGLGRDAATAEGYIQRIEKEFGIVDDKLRPAYTKLAIATRDTAKTERLMGIAMDISANSGKDLESITAALSKAYLGNNATLSKLGIGISKADLKTKSFKEITDQLAVTFAGAAKTSADSFSGSMDKLAIASNNAKEIIGTSLINALQSLGDDDSISTLGADIEGAATSLANFVDSIVYLKEQVKSIPGAGIFGYLFSGVTDLLGRFSPQRLAELIKAIKGFQGMGNVSMTGGSNMDTQRSTAKAIAASKAAATIKIKADKAAATKDLALKKAAAVFDITRIQIAAALKATYDKDERLRLLAMQEIENDNGEAALEYIKMMGLLTKEQQTNKLAGITTISETELNYINQLLLDELQRIKTTKMSEEEAAAARSAAYAKYNAAIQQSGGLAQANFYSEKTQVELISIAKLASLDKVASAQATMDILNYTTQTDIIARIAAAQKIADDAKYKALQDYLALLAQPLPTPGLGGGNGGGLKKPEFGIGGQPIYPEGGGFADYMGTTTTSSSGGSVDNSVTIVVEGSVLDGDDFSEIINRTMLDNIRRGFAQNPAGYIVE